MLTMVLTTVGLPLEGIAIIAGIDRILDMARTATNVTGDLMVSVLIAKSEGELNEDTYNADADTKRKQIKSFSTRRRTAKLQISPEERQPRDNSWKFIDMNKHILIGGAIGMFGFATLDTIGLIAPFITTDLQSDLATALVYGGGIILGMIGGEIVRRFRTTRNH